MPRYKFTGDQPEIFPTIVLETEDGFRTLTAEPGQVFEIADEIEHARLELTEDPVTPEPEPEPEVVPEPPAPEPEPDAPAPDPAPEA